MFQFEIFNCAPLSQRGILRKKWAIKMPDLWEFSRFFSDAIQDRQICTIFSKQLYAMAAQESSVNDY
jgi:N-acyl-L-homoserine lactone synthetase